MQRSRARQSAFSKYAADSRAIGIARFAAQSRGAVHRSAIHSAFHPQQRRDSLRLWAGVRVQRHRDDERGPALRPFYNNFRPHLFRQYLDQAGAETGWLV